MIDGLKSYPAMKDSGVPWLGKVPEHWKMVPLCAIARPKKLTGKQDRELLSFYLDRGVVRFCDVQEKRTNVTSEDLSKYQAVDPGDFVLNNQQAWRGSVGVSRHTGIVSPAYLVLSLTPQIIPEFANLLFRDGTMVNQYLISSKGVGSIQRNLYWPYLKRTSTPLPPHSEQASIVHFLDHVDRKIRQYIRGKQKLIKVLEEQKQAIIHRAVTRGLDPNVRRKPSGVEWLGNVPEHWDVSQIRVVAQVVRGGSPRPAGSPVYFHGGAEPWITVGELTKDHDMYLQCTATRLTEAGVERSRVVGPGTLLLTNSGATLGVPKITKIQGCINDGVAAFLRVRPNIMLEFLYFYWMAQTPHLRAWVDLGAQPNLNTQIIGGWPVVIPPPSEQRSIVDELTTQTLKTAHTEAKARDEIELLGEYRTRLIADVVTGKLDVREATGRLQDEVDEADMADEAESPDGEEELADELDAELEEVEV